MTSDDKEPDISVNIEKLKEQFNNDPLQFHLNSRILDCKRRREAFWGHYSKMRFRNNLIGIPLLIFTSATSVTAVSQIHSFSQWLAILTTIFGVLSAFTTSLQRYMRYSERAEEAKYLAKNYGRIATKIEDFIIFIESPSANINADSFNNFVTEIHKDIQTLSQEANEMPKTLRNSPQVFNEKLKTLANIELTTIRSVLPQADQSSLPPSPHYRSPSPPLQNAVVVRHLAQSGFAKAIPLRGGRTR
jgi:hypothetical protein